MNIKFHTVLDIIIENIGINTEYCFDSNGSDEFKCECKEGFDGKRCEDECSECGMNGSCSTEIDITTGIKQWKCLCVIPWIGERCDKLATCDGNLCHNGGACTTTAQADS